jgi:hypothetical protein
LLASELGTHYDQGQRLQVKDDSIQAKDSHRSEPSGAEGADAPVSFTFSNCRAKAIPGIVGFSECLTERGAHCNYVVIFPQGSLCQHPAHWEIAEKTRHRDSAGA